MAELKITRTDTLTNVGGTITYSKLDYVGLYIIDGSCTLGGDWTITDDSASVEGTTFHIRYLATVTISANNISVFGVQLTAEQALKNLDIQVYYNGSTYDVQIMTDFGQTNIVESNQIVNGAITTAKLDATGGSEAVTTATIRDLNVTTGKIAANAVTFAKLDTTGGSEAVQTTTIKDLAVTTGKINTKAVTTAKIDDQAVTYAQIADSTISVAKLDPTALALLNTCDIKCAKISVTTTELLALNPFGKVLVLAQGLGTIIVPLQIIVSLTYNTTPYATNTTLIIEHGAVGVKPLFTNTQTLISTGDCIYSFDYAAPVSTFGYYVSNSNLELNIDTGSTTAGDSDIDIYLLYRVVSL